MTLSTWCKLAGSAGEKILNGGNVSDKEIRDLLDQAFIDASKLRTRKSLSWLEVVDALVLLKDATAWRLNDPLKKELLLEVRKNHMKQALHRVKWELVKNTEPPNLIETVTDAPYSPSEVKNG